MRGISSRVLTPVAAARVLAVCPEVVEIRFLHADRPVGLRPLGREVPRRSMAPAGPQKARPSIPGSAKRERCSSSAGTKGGGRATSAPAGVALRRAGAQAGSGLDQDRGDGHGSVQQIEMPPGQSHKLAPAAPGQRRGTDQGRLAGLDGAGELIDLGDRRNRSLRTVLHTGTPYGAGIADDELVGDRGA